MAGWLHPYNFTSCYSMLIHIRGLHNCVHKTATQLIDELRWVEDKRKIKKLPPVEQAFEASHYSDAKQLNTSMFLEIYMAAVRSELLNRGPVIKFNAS